MNIFSNHFNLLASQRLIIDNYDENHFAIRQEIMRILTTETRRRIEEMIDRLGNGEPVTLDERIQLNKYSTHLPFVAGKISQALRRRMH